MDVDWPSYNTSNIFDAAYEVLSKRKTFLNIGLEKSFYLYYLIVLLKSCAAGYGIVHVIPHKLTYAFLFIQVSFHFLIRETWLFLLGEVIHAVLHLGVLRWVYQIDEYPSSFPSLCIWYYYSSTVPVEFFLDCYVMLTFLYYLGKYYYTRPHYLSTMVCVLFTINWMVDKFVSQETTTLLQNVIYYYIPVLFLKSYNTGEEVNAFAEVYGSVWLVYKMSHIVSERTPAGTFEDSLKINFGEWWNAGQNLSVTASRKSFLNFDEIEHKVPFYTLLLLKSFIASYSVRNIVGVHVALKMMSTNFVLALCHRNAFVAFSCIVRLFICGFQNMVNMGPLSFAFRTGIWYWVCCDQHFHFFLDVYLIIAALMYIEMAYKGQLDKLSSLLWFLYLVDWLGDEFVGKPLSRITTIGTLYFPVTLITSCTGISKRNRILFMIVLITLWLLFKHESDFFEYSVKYIFNFDKIPRDFLKAVRFWNKYQM